MEFKEYKEKIINTTPYCENLTFKFYVWIHNNKRLPAILHNVDDFSGEILNIPKYVKNKYGNMVPVVEINNRIFCKNKKLTDIIIPNSISNFSENTFEGCKNLKRVNISKKINKIPRNTFKDCVNLEEVYYEGSEEDWKKVDIFTDDVVIDDKKLGLIVKVENIHHTGNDALLNAKIHYNCKFFDRSESQLYKQNYGYTLEELLKKSVYERFMLIANNITFNAFNELFDKDFGFWHDNFLKKLNNENIIKYYPSFNCLKVENLEKYENFIKTFVDTYFCC